MTDSVSRKLDALAAHLAGLETAAAGLAVDPSVGISVRRIARALEAAALGAGLTEVAAGAAAIQRAADAHLVRSVANFLARIDELKGDAPAEDVTILIVEDNRTVAAATHAYLKGPGREILLAQTAAAAEALLASRDIDVVVLDLILPDRDGRDLLVQMREHASTTPIPVIVLSSTSNAVAKAECLAVGADEFLEKPVDPGTLRAAVARQIRSGRKRRDAVRDGLTGLPNRAGLLAEFEEQRRLASKNDAPLSVAVLTLGSLAQITMKLGRDAGDRFLLEVASAVHEGIGRGDRLGRWETTELVALLPGRTGDDARRILTSTIEALAHDDALLEFREAGIHVGVTGGVTTVRPDQDLRAAIAAAERPLHTARTSNEKAVVTDADPIEIRVARILVVEDDRVTSTLVHHRLVRDGHEVRAFDNGARALEWASGNDFECAVLDVKVPGMDGFELLAKLRAEPRHADVPIIMLTGMGAESDVIRGLELGADDYMLKPFSPSELLARVRRLLLARANDEQSAKRPSSDPVSTGPIGEIDGDGDGGDAASGHADQKEARG